MNNFARLRLGLVAMLTLGALAMAAVACGGGNDSATESLDSASRDAWLQSGADGDGEAMSAKDGPAGDPGPQFGIGSSTPGGSAAATVTSSRLAAAPTPTAAAMMAPTPRPFATPPASAGSPPNVDPDFSSSETGSPAGSQDPLGSEQPQVGSERIIVRNVDIAIEVPDPADAIQTISNLANTEGGWVVRTQNIEVHRGAIDIRVPADRLDAVLATLRDLASDVVSEVSTSQDFTEEFTDTTARIQTLQDTVDALRLLFERAEKIEDALEIQREITRIQADIEAMQARINFLSQSAAFSLVRVSVLALPQTMEIDAGGDKLAAVGRVVRFRAEFTPPEGIDNFRIEWDFGDGTGRQVVTAVAPVDTEGRVISAPVVHVYGDDTDSPYIVKVTVNGTGESGAAEGEDVMVVTVNRVPPIEVFAGENRIVTEDDEVTFKGSFTRPEGVDSLEFTWDFGDGTAPVTVDANPDDTVAEIKHTFANSRPRSYDVVLTVRGETAVGMTEGTDSLQVLVEEPEGLTSGEFTPGDSGRSAFRALSSIGRGLAIAGIWIGVFSPVWIILGVVGFAFYRNNKRNRDRRTSETLSAQSTQDRANN